MLRKTAAFAGLIAAALLASAAAYAQVPSVDLKISTNPSPCVTSCAVTLTWTSSNAVSCANDWSGAVSLNGNQTLANVTASRAYTFTCKGAPETTVTLAWVPPTANTNGTPLTNLAKYRIFRGPSDTTLAQIAEINAPAESLPLTSQPTGKQFYGVQAVSAANIASDMSNLDSKDFSGATVSKAVSNTVETKPNAPVLKTIATQAYQYTTPANDTLRVATVGTIAKGIACKPGMDVNGYNVVPKSSVTNWTISSAARTALRVVVAKCGA